MDTVTQAKAKRPKLVWAVLLYYVLSIGYTFLSYVLIFSGAIPITQEQAAYFGNLSAFDWSVSTLTAFLNVAGAIAIFQFRKIAFHLFATAFAFVILQTVVHTIATNFVAALGGPGAVGALIGYGILLAICVYAWKLKARGILV